MGADKIMMAIKLSKLKQAADKPASSADKAKCADKAKDKSQAEGCCEEPGRRRGRSHNYCDLSGFIRCGDS